MTRLPKYKYVAEACKMAEARRLWGEIYKPYPEWLYDKCVKGTPDEKYYTPWWRKKK